MADPSPYLPHKVTTETRPDGTIVLSSELAMGPVARNSGDWLHHWADARPDQVFLAERSGAGWRRLSYAVAFRRVRAVAAALVERGLTAGTPILILSGNSIDHGVLALAAQYVGVPVVPVAEQYALIPAAHARLRQVVDLVRPRMVYVSDTARFGAALGMEMLEHLEVVASKPRDRGVTNFAELAKGASVDLDAIHAGIGRDSVAKILMTSGSASSPKGVVTTQGMMCVNQAQMAAVFPFLGTRPPRILDWLPWNHVFGGSHNFNMMLANGGSLYINDGKPVPGQFGRTLENLSMMPGTLLFDVPMGYAMLLAAIEHDAALRRAVFADLDMIFYAGAAVGQAVWDGLHAAALTETGTVPLMSAGWGMTETAPACLMVHEASARAGTVGVPLPGVTAKLMPAQDGRHELRVKGPNVMPCYFQDPERTTQSFDAEGFLVTDDAVRLVDPGNVNAGLMFDGRLTEDFKLQSGTWVRATSLRLDILARLAPLISDLVITGEGRTEIGALIFPTANLPDDDLRHELAARLAGQGAGTSVRVARLILMDEPPSLADGEVTAKGNLNPRNILKRRAELLARLYDDTDPDVIRI